MPRRCRRPQRHDGPVPGAGSGALRRQVGVQVTRILTDNGGNYRSTVFGTAVTTQGIRHKCRRGPFRPQTNGKAVVPSTRRSTGNEWAYARVYLSNEELGRPAGVPSTATIITAPTAASAGPSSIETVNNVSEAYT